MEILESQKFLFLKIFFSENLILSLRLTRWVRHDTNLSLNSNISKMVRVNVTFTHVFERIFNKLSNDTQGDRLCTCGSLVIDVYVYGNFGISKINKISLSRHEQVCLMRLRIERYILMMREASLASLNILVPDVINLLYYEH